MIQSLFPMTGLTFFFAMVGICLLFSFLAFLFLSWKRNHRKTISRTAPSMDYVDPNSEMGQNLLQVHLASNVPRPEPLPAEKLPETPTSAARPLPPEPPPTPVTDPPRATIGKSNHLPSFFDIFQIPLAAVLVWHLVVQPLSLPQGLFLTALFTALCYAAVGGMIFFEKRRHPAPLPPSSAPNGHPSKISEPLPKEPEKEEEKAPENIPQAPLPLVEEREEISSTKPSLPLPEPFVRFKEDEKNLIKEVQQLLGLPDHQLSLSDQDIDCLLECTKRLREPLKMFMDTRFPLKSPEKLFYTFSASLMEAELKSSARVYFPLESDALAFKGLHLQTSEKSLSEGTIGITSQRFLFSAGRLSFSLTLDRISLIDLSANGLTIHYAGTPKKVSIKTTNPPLILLLMNRCYLE